MTLRLALVTLAVLTAPLAAQNPDPDKPVQGGGRLPTGWSARVDKDAAMTNVKFETMGPTGLHVTTGPAVILWKETDKGTGGFHTEATFTQTKAPQHAEAYGLFVGGKDLKGEGQAGDRQGELAKLAEEAKQRLDFLPDLFSHEIFLTALGLFILVLVIAFFYQGAPLENVPILNKRQ